MLYYFRMTHPISLVLVSAGSGITPMMSIVRFLSDADSPVPITFLHGARREEDIIFAEECRRLAERHAWFRYWVTLSQPSESWGGPQGRIDGKRLLEMVENPADCRFFLCGPNAFMNHVKVIQSLYPKPPGRRDSL